MGTRSLNLIFWAGRSIGKKEGEQDSLSTFSKTIEAMLEDCFSINFGSIFRCHERDKHAHPDNFYRSQDGCGSLNDVADLIIIGEIFPLEEGYKNSKYYAIKEQKNIGNRNRPELYKGILLPTKKEQSRKTEHFLVCYNTKTVEDIETISPNLVGGGNHVQFKVMMKSFEGSGFRLQHEIIACHIANNKPSVDSFKIITEQFALSKSSLIIGDFNWEKRILNEIEKEDKLAKENFEVEEISFENATSNEQIENHPKIVTSTTLKAASKLIDRAWYKPALFKSARGFYLDFGPRTIINRPTLIMNDLKESLSDHRAMAVRLTS